MPNYPSSGIIALVNASLGMRVLVAPAIATVWLVVAALWALMQGRRDAATYKTLTFGFFVVIVVLYITQLTYPRLDSALGLGFVTGFIVFSLWWFQHRLKGRNR